MSQLRAPAANRADRREGGGRHGKAAQQLPEAHIRPQLLRIAVLPAVAVSLGGAAAVLFALRSADGGGTASPLLWAILAGAAAVALTGIAVAAVAADRTARNILDRAAQLRRTSARNQAELRDVLDALRRGEQPTAQQPPLAPRGDGFDLLGEELHRAHRMAVHAVVQAAQLSSQAGSEQKVEVFVNLARRLQSLVHREIQLLDELENQVEDPDLLKGLFHVDHLSTRIRRHAENLAVLGGAMSRRQWSRPVSMTEVLRSAIAEVEQYSRVKLVPPIDGDVRGHAVADTIHLLAELVENATVFSAPHTQVLLRASRVAAGVAVEVEDRGLGMPGDEQRRMNALLADPDQVNVASLLQDGRIGLYVVATLARRHGIAVRLQSNIYGGTQAVLVLPATLLGTVPDAQPAPESSPARRRRPHRRPGGRSALPDVPPPGPVAEQPLGPPAPAPVPPTADEEPATVAPPFVPDPPVPVAPDEAPAPGAPPRRRHPAAPADPHHPAADGPPGPARGAARGRSRAARHRARPAHPAGPRHPGAAADPRRGPPRHPARAPGHRRGQRRLPPRPRQHPPGPAAGAAQPAPPPRPGTPRPATARRTRRPHRRTAPRQPRPRADGRVPAGDRPRRGPGRAPRPPRARQRPRHRSG
ncbi:sensor histidine kinase [Streptomyces albidoflavus]|uniref:sensor histidine kinase n=1 Tax=Streptomyces albidoflavus TaxID=1886 RepID=UPI00226EB933|nr:ATP-binding protein [Streptomyces albidoflavus]CAI4175087.1 Sensor-like histidine kinase [Streptomyces albidoflavus]